MEELGKSIPAAESFVDAEGNTGKPHPHEFCLNCGTKLQDVFCHHCGQKDIPARQTLGELFVNFVSSFWSYEGKFFQTTKYLLIKPGFLAAEYCKGRRESYFHPARMYVFASFLFFLLLVSLPDTDNTAVQVGLSEKEKKELAKIGLDSTFRPSDSSYAQYGTKYIPDSVKKNMKNNNRFSWGITGSDYKSVKEYDSIQKTLPEEKRDGWFERRMEIRSMELNERYEGDFQKFGKDFVASFSENFSKVLFYLMPFFALILKLLYIRRDSYYSEHLVLTIYYYNFFYIAGCLMMILNLIPWLDWLSVIVGFWIYFYLLFAMKRMYGQGWGKTIVKFLIFSFLFSILAGIGTTINAIAALMTI